jgi:hypothetical protein
MLGRGRRVSEERHLSKRSVRFSRTRQLLHRSAGAIEERGSASVSSRGREVACVYASRGLLWKREALGESERPRFGCRAAAAARRRLPLPLPPPPLLEEGDATSPTTSHPKKRISSPPRPLPRPLRTARALRFLQKTTGARAKKKNHSSPSPRFRQSHPAPPRPAASPNHPSSAPERTSRPTRTDRRIRAGRLRPPRVVVRPGDAAAAAFAAVVGSRARGCRGEWWR